MSQNKLDGLLKYAIRVGDASSQLLNVAVLLGDNANESVSGRSHRMKEVSKSWSVLNTVIDFVFLGTDHCERAYFNDVTRAKKTIDEAIIND
jgi:hypothetical protein